MSFANKVVLVTGASSGIGAAAAILFCKEGAHVALVGRNEAKLDNTSGKCAQAGGKHILIKADVSNDDDARRIVRETINKFGRLDILVNNAGVIVFGSIIDGTVLDAFDQVMPVNLRAVVHLTALAAPHLIKTKGNIINISSVAGQGVVNTAFTAYATTKAALDHFTRGSALELAPSGVRVNAISPGPVDTDLYTNSGSTMEKELDGIVTPLGRVSNSEEIADLVLFIASDKARGITGSVYVTDNGVLVKGMV
jgi:NAD(P)-dependent dehydrogenase (short-subunit alcohol dehydrogenase family)